MADFPKMSWDGFKQWLERAGQVIDKKDLLMLTPIGVFSVLRQLSQQRRTGTQSPVAADDPDVLDAELIDVFADFFRVVGEHYFRLKVEGVENVPATGPVLLVGNHNGGVLPLDTIFTVLAVYDRFGIDRYVHGLGHDSLFSNEVIGRYALRLGALRARPQIADQALQAGKLLLVYPGSDWDACRTFGERNRVILHGRTGFLKLALRNRVPIVPVVSVGTHEQLIILTRGERLAKFFHLHRLMRTDTFPLALSLPWGLSTALIPYLPLPAQTSIAFGEPLRFDDVAPEQAEDEGVLSRCYQTVETRMQAMLDELARDRIPILGKLGG